MIDNPELFSQQLLTQQLEALLKDSWLVFLADDQNKAKFCYAFESKSIMHPKGYPICLLKKSYALESAIGKLPGEFNKLVLLQLSGGNGTKESPVEITPVFQIKGHAIRDIAPKILALVEESRQTGRTIRDILGRR